MAVGWAVAKAAAMMVEKKVEAAKEVGWEVERVAVGWAGARAAAVKAEEKVEVATAAVTRGAHSAEV